jgi:hypothetical protein
LTLNLFCETVSLHGGKRQKQKTKNQMKSHLMIVGLFAVGLLVGVTVAGYTAGKAAAPAAS